MNDENQPNQPVTTIRAGGVKATVWENQSKEGNTYFSVSVTRSYKDGEEWKDTGTYYRDDLPKIELVVRKAYEFIQLEVDRQTSMNGAGESSFTGKIDQERTSKREREI